MNHATSEPAAVAIAAVGGFLLGSIPWGVILLKLAGRPDPRTIGSGNIGATNVTRAGGKGLGATVLVLDALKGSAAIALAPGVFGPAVAALAAVLGHCFTPWLRFKGGKGVATYLGVSFVAGLPALLSFLVAWAAAFVASRISAVAGVTAASVSALVAITMAALDPQPQAFAAAGALAAAAVVVALRHRTNFAQLAEKRRLRAQGGPT